MTEMLTRHRRWNKPITMTLSLMLMCLYSRCHKPQLRPCQLCNPRPQPQPRPLRLHRQRPKENKVTVAIDETILDGKEAILAISRINISSPHTLQSLMNPSRSLSTWNFSLGRSIIFTRTKPKDNFVKTLSIDWNRWLMTGLLNMLSQNAEPPMKKRGLEARLKPSCLDHTC